MDVIQRGKVFSCVISLVFGVLSIIGFSSSQKLVTQYSNYSIFFGIVSCCFALLWIQVLYRLSKIGIEQIQSNNKECFVNMKQLIISTLESQDYTFQIFFSSTSAIILSYVSISFFFSKEFAQFLPWVFEYYENDKDLSYYDYYYKTDYMYCCKQDSYNSYDCKYDYMSYQDYSDEGYETDTSENYDLVNMFNQFIFMIIFSIFFGVYLQINFTAKIFFKIFDIQKGNNNLVIKLNLNLKDPDLQVYQKNIVIQCIIYIFIWISLLIIRLVLYIYYIQEFSSKENYYDKYEINEYKEYYNYQYYSGFLCIQTGCLILYCLIIGIFLIQILLHIKNNYFEIISINNENFSSWLLLISSLVHSSKMKIISVFVLCLLLSESIYGLIILNTQDSIFTLLKGKYINENVLIIDTVTITILTIYKFLDLLLTFLFPQSHPPPAKYNFTAQQIIYQVQTVEINENQNNNLTPQTPVNGGGKLT